MIETKVAKRFAKSLIGLGKERGLLDKLAADMQLVKGVCEVSREFVLMLNSPIITSDRKLKMINSIFGSRMHEVTSAFLEIITNKRREKYLPEIATNFITQFKEIKGIQLAEVISADGLDESIRQKVYDIIKQSTNKEVELTEKTDKELIGGFILRMGDKQVDASVSNELRKLRQQLIDTSFTRKN